jgi:hypothetical protein
VTVALGPGSLAATEQEHWICAAAGGPGSVALVTVQVALGSLMLTVGFVPKPVPVIVTA